MSGSVSGGQSACCCSSPLAAPRALDNSQAPLATRRHRDVRITGRSIWIERLQLFLPTTSSTTEQVLAYLERHHWFFWGSRDPAIHFIFTTKTLPDLTRLTDGLMESGSVLLVTTDWQRRLVARRRPSRQADSVAIQKCIFLGAIIYSCAS